MRYLCPIIHEKVKIMSAVNNFRYNPETDTNHYFSFNDETLKMTERVTKTEGLSTKEVEVETKTYIASERQIAGLEWAESGKRKQI